MSKELKANELIPKTDYVKIIIDNSITKYGTLMDVALGISPEQIKQKRVDVATLELQRTFSRLYLFDIVCRQTDHRAGHDGNYNVLLDHNHKGVCVSAFDNDNPTTFLPSANISFITSSRATPFVKNGFVSVKYLCAEMCETIRHSEHKRIRELLKCYLSNFQIKYIIKRIKIINKLIKNHLIKAGYVLWKQMNGAIKHLWTK